MLAAADCEGQRSKMNPGVLLLFQTSEVETETFIGWCES